MERTTFGDSLDSPGSSASDDDILSKTPGGALAAAVHSIAHGPDAAASTVKRPINQAAAVPHHVVDNTAGSAAPAAPLVGERERRKAIEKRRVKDTSGHDAAIPLMPVGIAVLAGFLISQVIRS